MEQTGERKRSMRMNELTSKYFPYKKKKKNQKIGILFPEELSDWISLE